MPEKKTIERAKRDEREGKAPSTQAGEFVREEMHHIRQGKHGARSTEQAIAIGLSKARRAGVPLPPPKKGSASVKARRDAARAEADGGREKATVSRTRSRAAREALEREGGAAATERALASHARGVARRRSAADRSSSAKKAARTKGPAKRAAAARKAARTRAERGRGREG